MTEIDYLIDPGHGGVDPGSSGNGQIEKEWSLKISIYMHHRLLAHGVRSQLTRSTDTTLEPSKRAKLVKESGATRCISNHLNSGGAGEGIEVIHSKEVSGLFAKKIADAVVAAGQKPRTRRYYSRTGNDGRDYYYMHRLTGNVDTYIIEWEFITSEVGMKRFTANWKRYVEAVIKVMVEAVGKQYRAPEQRETPIDKLYQMGVITTPAYWRDNAKAGRMRK